jgi:DNA-binding NtrC family response regulator
VVRHLLVVEDDVPMREMLDALFSDIGYRVTTADSAERAMQLLADEEFDLVLSDIHMSGRSGIELVADVRKLRPDVPVILMTAFGHLDSAIEAIRAGAFDYLTKPFEPETAVFALERAMERRTLVEENRRLRRAVSQTESLGDLSGRSAAMRELTALIRKVAFSRSSVLVQGESGTGKEVVARTIHFHGNRAAKAFVPINCAAIPEGLLESELFGHVRGAFTGAHTSHKGLFVAAEGGTLFLDEIGDMGMALQAKLLRVLQDREVRPVGGSESISIDVRIIAATHRDLETAIAEGRFREDLYYRLAVIPMRIPPLRERPDDIAALAEVFLRKHDETGFLRLSPDALPLLLAHPWRGNARELENVIERAIALTDTNEIGPEALPIGKERAPAAPGSPDALIRASAGQHLPLREVEELYIEEVLRVCGGNRHRAAAILGIDRKTLYRRAGPRNAAADDEL